MKYGLTASEEKRFQTRTSFSLQNWPATAVKSSLNRCGTAKAATIIGLIILITARIVTATCRALDHKAQCR